MHMVALTWQQGMGLGPWLPTAPTASLRTNHLHRWFCCSLQVKKKDESAAGEEEERTVSIIASLLNQCTKQVCGVKQHTSVSRQVLLDSHSGMHAPGSVWQ